MTEPTGEKYTCEQIRQAQIALIPFMVRAYVNGLTLIFIKEIEASQPDENN